MVSSSEKHGRHPRRPDWQQAFNKYLIGCQQDYPKTVVWGRFDCCTFAFNWVQECIGVDPMAEYRGRYTSRAEAMQMLREMGGNTLYNACRGFFGDPVPGTFGRRGDVGYHDGCLGLIVGRAGLFLGDEHFLVVPIQSVRKVFRV